MIAACRAQQAPRPNEVNGRNKSHYTLLCIQVAIFQAITGVGCCHIQTVKKCSYE
jgi:hypothetical protein